MRAPVEETIEWFNDPPLLVGFRRLLKERWNVSLEEWIAAERFSTSHAFFKCLDFKECHWNLLLETGEIPPSQTRWKKETWDRQQIIALLRLLGWVYFAELHDFIKIGYSAQIDVGSRIKELEASTPYSITLIHSIPGSLKTERFLHKKFSHLHHSREWFRRDQELLDFIETLR